MRTSNPRNRSGIVYGPHSSDKREAARQMRREPTPAEDALWQRLRRSQLHGLHFRRQQIIDGFIVDFYCHGVGLVVEVDGPVHRRQVEADRARDGLLASRGLRVVRFSNDEVMEDPDGVLAVIATQAMEGIRNPAGPFPGGEGAGQPPGPIGSPSLPGKGSGVRP